MSLCVSRCAYLFCASAVKLYRWFDDQRITFFVIDSDKAMAYISQWWFSCKVARCHTVDSLTLTSIVYPSVYQSKNMFHFFLCLVAAYTSGVYQNKKQVDPRKVCVAKIGFGRARYIFHFFSFVVVACISGVYRNKITSWSAESLCR